MKILKHKWLPFALLLIASSIFLLHYYSALLFHPNAYILVPGGDGLKNYYTYAYHLKNDSSYTHFEGMNYPYGDLPSFADAQPALSNGIKFFAKAFPVVSDYSIGILNFAMIISFLFCFICLYFILRKLNIPRYFSAIAAIGIGIMSPQTERILGHYGLSYCFFIPLIWLLIILFFENKRPWLYTILIIISSTLATFLHPYLGLICSSFVTVWWIVYFIQNRKVSFKKISNYFFAAIQAFAAIFIFKLYLFINDHHIGRTDHPGGIFSHNARAETIFLPHDKPFVGAVKTFYDLKDQAWEGWAYVGIIGVFILVFSVIKIYRYIINEQFIKIINPVLPDTLRTGIWTGIIILLFSMAYPFQLGLESLLNFVPPLKQFRSIGRFAWVFYYTFLVYGTYIVYLMWRYLRSKKSYLTANLLITIFLVLLFAEGLPYHKRVKLAISKTPNNAFNVKYLPKSYLSAIEQIKKSDYQAIIPIPFFHEGTEYVYIFNSHNSFYTSQILSYHTGLALVASYMSRTSEPEMLNILSIISETDNKDNIRRDLPSDKPFLIIYTKEKLVENNDKQLLAKSKLVWSESEFDLYSLSCDSLLKGKNE